MRPRLFSLVLGKPSEAFTTVWQILCDSKQKIYRAYNWAYLRDRHAIYFIAYTHMYDELFM